MRLFCANVSPLKSFRCWSLSLVTIQTLKAEAMSGSGKKGPGPAYNSPPARPSAPAYPVQQGPPMAPMGAPPTYSPAPPPGHHTYPQQPYYPGSAVPQAPAYPQNQYAQAYPTTPNMAMYTPPPAGQTVVVPGLFDAGARFDGGAQPSIPPPPPGCAPNAAQMAAMQGHQVMGTQQRGNFWTDGSGGGVSFW